MGTKRSQELEEFLLFFHLFSVSLWEEIHMCVAWVAFMTFI